MPPRRYLSTSAALRVLDLKSRGMFKALYKWMGLTSTSVDTVGVHYSGTLWRWYRNWLGNAEKVKAKYGERWFRVSTLKDFGSLEYPD